MDEGGVSAGWLRRVRRPPGWLDGNTCATRPTLRRRPHLSRARSSSGRAPVLQAGGGRFDPGRVHGGAVSRTAPDPAPVAQRDSAPDYESGGREFESLRGHQATPVTASGPESSSHPHRHQSPALPGGVSHWASIRSARAGAPAIRSTTLSPADQSRFATDPSRSRFGGAVAVNRARCPPAHRNFLELGHPLTAISLKQGLPALISTQLPGSRAFRRRREPYIQEVA